MIMTVMLVVIRRCANLRIYESTNLTADVCMPATHSGCGVWPQGKIHLFMISSPSGSFPLTRLSAMWSSKCFIVDWWRNQGRWLLGKNPSLDVLLKQNIVGLYFFLSVLFPGAAHYQDRLDST